jgi:hypothetical protein
MVIIVTILLVSKFGTLRCCEVNPDNVLVLTGSTEYTQI